MFYIYIIQSKKDNKLYTGYTRDIKKRISEHNLGKVRSTKARRPFELIYREEFKTKKEAIERERELKTGQWRELIKEIIKYGGNSSVG